MPKQHIGNHQLIAPSDGDGYKPPNQGGGFKISDRPDPLE
jgi:hypothetical protein